MRWSEMHPIIPCLQSEIFEHRNTLSPSSSLWWKHVALSLLLLLLPLISGSALSASQHAWIMQDWSCSERRSTDVALLLKPQPFIKAWVCVCVCPIVCVIIICLVNTHSLKKTFHQSNLNLLLWVWLNTI